MNGDQAKNRDFFELKKEKEGFEVDEADFLAAGLFTFDEGQGEKRGLSLFKQNKLPCEPSPGKADLSIFKIICTVTLCRVDI